MPKKTVAFAGLIEIMGKFFTNIVIILDDAEDEDGHEILLAVSIHITWSPLKRLLFV